MSRRTALNAEPSRREKNGVARNAAPPDRAQTQARQPASECLLLGVNTFSNFCLYGNSSFPISIAVLLHASFCLATMSLPGDTTGALPCSIDASQRRQDPAVPPPQSTALQMSESDDSSKPAVAMPSVSTPSATSKLSGPSAEDGTLQPTNDPLPLPFEFQISVGMLFVVDREEITGDLRYAAYLARHDEASPTKRDFRPEGEYAGFEIWELMEDYYGQRRANFVVGILREEGDLEVCDCVLGWCKCTRLEKWHVLDHLLVSLTFCAPSIVDRPLMEKQMYLPAKEESDDEGKVWGRKTREEKSDKEGSDKEDTDDEESTGYESDGRTIIQRGLSWRERLRNRSKFADKWWDYGDTTPRYVDSVGVSLTSRSLEFPSPEDEPVHRGGLDEVAEYLDVLADHKDKPWQCLSTSYHGRVQVHIILPSGHGDGERVLRVLQHLAYLIVKYEDVILYYYREAKRPGRDFEDLYSNRDGITPPKYRQCKPFSLGPLEDVKRKIFARDMTLDTLSVLMAAVKYWKDWEEPTSSVYVSGLKFVDFRDIGEDRCLVFRQLRGTMDSGDINDWIQFVTTLVRTAEMKAEEAPALPDNGILSDSDWGLREGNKYNDTFGTFHERKKELYHLMKLPGSSSKYRQPRPPPKPEDVAVPSTKDAVEEEPTEVQDDGVVQDQALTGEKRKREADENADSETDESEIETPAAKCARWLETTWPSE